MTFEELLGSIIQKEQIIIDYPLKQVWKDLKKANTNQKKIDLQPHGTALKNQY